MKYLTLGLLFLFCTMSNICCAQDSLVRDVISEEVYLTVETVTVSSFDGTADWAPPPEFKAVIDGDLLSRWSSNYTDNQWICFDFGTPKVLSKVVIFWEAAYAVDYDILYSLDNQNWQTILSLKNQDGSIDEIEFRPIEARFIKLLGKKRFNPDWGISVWETVFLGPDKDNPQERPLSEVYPRLASQLAGEEPQAEEISEKPVDSPGVLTPEEFQKGVVYTSWSKTELGAEASDQTLEHLKELGVRNLGIMIVWFQDTIEEKTIYADSRDTPEDKALLHAINKAHSLGMKVMLKPHVDVKTDQWRGDIIPSQDWFAAYKNYITYYARLAAQYNVEVFSIGTELVNTTTLNWQDDWQELINEVREVFSGSLTYSANWDEYQAIGFWDKLDFIGIDAYFPLTQKKDPTKEELSAAWKINAQEINNWLTRKEIKKPVVFTEIGYCSADGTNIQPWSVLSNLPREFMDQQEQADALEAMLVVCSSYPWFKGLYWWNYFPQKRWSPLGYTIRGKKAEEILSEWFKIKRR